ncbi:MAG: CpsD/CapB family tyrosine-protein kinase [Hyphomicrobiales bacterium]
MTAAEKKPKSRPTLFDVYDPDAPVVTEVRRLLQNLARQAHATERKVFLITSAARGEGKSTIAGLLSMVSAQVFRRRTLLIDADLRRPTIHDLMGLSQKPGLFEVLHHRSSTESAVRPTPIPSLSVLTSGSPTGAMGSAYDDDRFGRVLETLRPQYDMIFVDSAPAVPVIEPLLMAEHVDGILLVAMAGKTPVTMVRRLKQVLAPVADRVVGSILNNATEGLPYYYEYRYYGYERLRKGKLRRSKTPDAAAPPEGGDDKQTGGTS